MPEEAIKQRMNRAINSARKGLEQPSGSYIVYLQKSGPFHIEAVREKEIRKIRVVLDKISTEDERILKRIKLPGICTKEIWCKCEGERGFVRKEVQ